MYEGLVLIDADSRITPEALVIELRRFYAGNPEAPTDIVVLDSVVTLSWPDYWLKAGWSSAPHVLEESAGLAERAGAHHPDRQRIARCASRVELSGDADPDMLRFNDYLFVGEALARLGNVYRFDQASDEFLE